MKTTCTLKGPLDPLASSFDHENCRQCKQEMVREEVCSDTTTPYIATLDTPRSLRNGAQVD